MLLLRHRVCFELRVGHWVVIAAMLELGFQACRLLLLLLANIEIKRPFPRSRHFRRPLAHFLAPLLVIRHYFSKEAWLISGRYFFGSELSLQLALF